MEDNGINMQKIIIILFFILPSMIYLSNCSGVDDNLNEDEQIIYTMIIDSIFNDTYRIIHINDSTHSLLRYIIKNTFSETLFNQEPQEYYGSFFKERNCLINEDLIKTFIRNNRKQYYIPENYKPDRDHKFVNYLSIYYFIRSGENQKNRLTLEIKDDVKFGLISLSRAGFNHDRTEALIEVNIHRKQLKEIFYCYLKKINGQWEFDSNCYMYGPYRIKE